MTIRVAVVDDHPMVVSGLVAALDAVEDLEIVAHASTIAGAREILTSENVDVVLLDVRLEDGNGIQLLADLGGRRQPEVIAISSFDAAQYAAAAAKFGASGFLLKSVPLPAIIEAIRSVAAGHPVFTPAQLAKRFVSLTSKEREVLALAMEGRSNKEIGARMGTSRKTVEAHLSRIFEKYGIRGGRIELSIKAAEEGWLDVQSGASSLATRRSGGRGTRPRPEGSA
jgi:DNA-binding NarL/FixJ family response regulator